MNKINTDIISTTGININKYDILPSKVFINGVEITDTESWNNAINKIDKKTKEIECSRSSKMSHRSFVNNDEKLLKKYINDLIKADMVEKVEEE